MNTLKKEMTNFVQWVYNIKAAFEKTPKEDDLASKI